MDHLTHKLLREDYIVTSSSQVRLERSHALVSKGPSGDLHPVSPIHVALLAPRSSRELGVQLVFPGVSCAQRAVGDHNLGGFQ